MDSAQRGARRAAARLSVVIIITTCYRPAACLSQIPKKQGACEGVGGGYSVDAAASLREVVRLEVAGRLGRVLQVAGRSAPVRGWCSYSGIVEGRKVEI